MPGLIRLRARTPSGRGRREDERGAVAVLVALLMVPLVGFAAVAVDIAGVYSVRQQLRNGSDAAALAIATDCLRGACGTPLTTARTFATSNLRTGTSTATIATQTATSVTVQNSAVRQHLFAPVIGIKSSPLSVRSTATWTSPISGNALLPIVVNRCEYTYQTGGGLPTGTTSYTLNWDATSVSSCSSTGFSSKYTPGGWDWVKVNYLTCRTSSAVAGEVQTNNSSNPPSGCTAAYFATLQNTTVLLPLFTAGRGSGSSAYFTILGYAPFRLTGYYFGSSFNWNSPCSGSNRCLRGYFTRLTTRSTDFSYGSAPHYGAGIITLTG